LFNKPKGLTPENIVKAVLNAPGRSAEPIRPEKVARAVVRTPEARGPNLLGMAQRVVAEQGVPSALERDILHLAREHRGMLTCALCACELAVPRREAQTALDRLANRGLARRVRGKDEVVYLFEQFLDKEPKSGGLQLSTLFSAAVWVYGRWTDYQQKQARQEQQLLDLAYRNQGWFTYAEAVHVLGKDAPACIERLKEAGLLEEMAGKNGQPVYVVEQFLPPSVVCAYCDSAHPAAETTCCNCGAGLQATVQ
jgi:hypothetical protein